MVTDEQLEMDEALETEEIVQLARSSSSPVGMADTRASTAAVKTNWRKACWNMIESRQTDAECSNLYMS